jgi:carbamoyltransferase
MITWGISANSHNAALAVFDDKKLVFASESERFSKKKNDGDLNNALVEHVVRYGAPDNICWYETPWLKTLRQFRAGQGILWFENDIKKYLERYSITAPITYARHHHSHAAAGYYTSKFDNACVVVIDSIGEFETLTIWEATGRRLEKLARWTYPNSLGLWYSAMTQRCGLKPNEEEYILMGMSALGDKTRLTRNIIDELFDIYHLSCRRNFHKGCLDWRPDLSSEQDIYDIAAATQNVYEMALDRILQWATELSGSKNLVLMGGCALNCVANSRAYNYFEDVWIMPAPGDNGSSIGAVLAKTQDHIDWPGVYLGFDLGSKASDDEIVQYLVENKICGLARGRAEFGPRALGNRSLIADPRGEDVKDRVNDIKHRERFRPFAPAILAEHAHRYFDIPPGRSSDYMQMTYKCLQPDLFPAIVHYDGTSRIQTVQRDQGSFRSLLEKWYAKTGCPMLLNTSLNIKGEPMINDHTDIKNWTVKYGLPIFN